MKDLMQHISDALQPMTGEHQRKEAEARSKAVEAAVDDYIEEMKEASEDDETTG